MKEELTETNIVEQFEGLFVSFFVLSLKLRDPSRVHRLCGRCTSRNGR